MRIFALSDLHLSFSGEKPMDPFGPWWSDHAVAIERSWRSSVGAGDVVCLPGDFSWAMKPEEAARELAWLEELPGTKILVKGNHDYWWGSIGRVRSLLPPSVRALQNDSVAIAGAGFAGARGWVDPTLDFGLLSGHVQPHELGEEGFSIKGLEEDRKIYDRELIRLETSLKSLGRDLTLRVALLHFPPTSPLLEDTAVTGLLEKYRVDAAVFGHVHRSGPTAFANPFGVKNGITYFLASADFVAFTPVQMGAVDG